MKEIILMAFERTDVRVARAHFRGVERLDIRNFMDINGERRPTKKGVSIPLDRVPDLIDALLALSGEADK